MHYALCASLCAPTYIQEQEIPNGQEEPDAPMKEAVGEEPDAPMKEAVGEGAFPDLIPGNYSLQLPETQASLPDDLATDLFAFPDDRQAILACAHSRAGAQELAVTTARFPRMPASWSRASPPHARFALQATQTQQDELEATLPRSLESALDKVADRMLCVNDFYDGDVGEAEAHVHVDSQRF
jgi:hypothetical protein